MRCLSTPLKLLAEDAAPLKAFALSKNSLTTIMRRERRRKRRVWLSLKALIKSLRHKDAKRRRKSRTNQSRNRNQEFNLKKKNLEAGAAAPKKVVLKLKRTNLKINPKILQTMRMRMTQVLRVPTRLRTERKEKERKPRRQLKSQLASERFN
jgi:hypothetical protein